MQQKTPLYITITIVAAVALTLGYWLRSGRQEEHASLVTEARDLFDGKGPPPTLSPADQEKARVVQAAADAKEKERATLARIDLRQDVTLGEETSRLLDEALAEEKRWHADVETLLTNDTGRYIAADDERVKAFRIAQKGDRPSADVLRDAKTRVDDMLAGPRAALQEASPPSPSAELRARLEKERQAARDAVAAYRDPREKIQALVDDGKTRGAAGSETLAAALERVDRNEALAALAETNRINEQVAAGKRVEEENRQKFLARATSQEMRDQFRPFLAKGWMRGIACRNSAMGLVDDEKLPYPGPMSYKAIQEEGALDNFGVFLKLATGGYPYDQNDRPRWPAPQSDQDVAKYRRWWLEFKNYASTWVEQGILGR